MPQLKTAKPAGPQSTVPCFTAWGLILLFDLFYSFLLKGPSLGHCSLTGFELAALCAFPTKDQPIQ